MKRLNTHSIYTLALRVHPLTELQSPEGEMKLQEVFFPLLRAEIILKGLCDGQDSYFSPSLKRSATTVLETIYDMGIDRTDVTQSDLSTIIKPWNLNGVINRAKEFETVLANELPGLATYMVSQKGIYSTDELISQAKMQVPEKYREVLSGRATEDIQQAGKCLAFEVSTASAFHMWRAVESIMNEYHKALTGKTFVEANVGRNWGNYIKALKEANAETRITTFLDHIREEYRNPITHPDETLDLDEAFGLFGTALSAITSMTRAILEIQEAQKLKEEAKALAVSAGVGSVFGGLLAASEEK
jgi:hypothetical protein